VSARPDKNERPVDHIAFLGLWDTVAAYGLPIDEMTRGVSRYLWPLELPDRQLHPLVRKACHALSLDDERTTFHPLLRDESPETDPKRITQVWFAGVHSNVGGGYPDDSLAHVSLTWILSEARSRGLTLKASPGADPDAFTRVRSTQDKDGRIYDSRNGLAGYYRYGPRSVAALSDTKFSDDKRDCVKIALPKIHESVFDRISVDAHLYAPVGLPPAYEILTYDEKILAPDKLTVPSGKPKYESLATARQREFTQEHVVGSSIWRRRIIYFLTVIASIYLATYPLTSTAPAAAEFTTPLRPLADIIRMVGLVLPGAASRWINAYAREPLWFALCAGLVALLLWLSTTLQGRITDQMRRAWRVSLAKIDLLRGEDKARSGASVLQLMAYAGLLSIALYPVPAWFGYNWPRAPGSLQTFIDRITHLYFQLFAIAILITMLMSDRFIARFRLKDAYRRFITTIKLKVAPAFFAVAFLLGGAAFATHYFFNFRDSFGHFCTPAAEPVALEICEPDEMKLCKRAGDGSFPSTCTSAACRGVDLAAFNTADLCTPVGVTLDRRGNYQFVLKKEGDWWFLGAPSGPGGMPLRAFLPDWKKDGLLDSAFALGRFSLLAIAYPLKRTLDRPFGRVIIRYGETGNEENFIDGEPTNGRLDEKFRATRDGQMFVYLNQPVSGVFSGLFRNVNSGRASVWVYRIPRS
jgi:type VI secretion system (T6SS) phospholipase Tle1-like effector